ncbi:nitrate- and nitrite sensing domain-containing protein [Cellulomonas soli]|uniref:sensor histidine kinase n=1 Tax=Cellulomonas soli TaxID=931535 RepID=UPI003F8530AA
MLRRLGIRAKVLAVLAVPMVVLLGLGAFITNLALTDARTARAAVEIVEVARAYLPLAQAIETERALSLTGGDDASITEARAATDELLAATRGKTGAMDLDQYPKVIVDQFLVTQEMFANTLPSARRSVDIDSQTAIIERGYSNIINSQMYLVQLIAENLDDRELARYVGAYSELGQTIDSLVLELIGGARIVATKAGSPATITAFTDQATTTELGRASARQAVQALGDESLVFPTKFPTSAFTRMRTLLQQGNPESAAMVDPALWRTEVIDQTTALSDLTDQVLAAGEVIGDANADAATRGAWINAGLAGAAAALSLFFAFVVSRGIVVPLRRLTAAAGEVREELPRLVEQVATPGEGPDIELPLIPVESSDEVGRLAAAFNAVNSTTVQVAQEQAALRGSIAEMFVNVARRDQVLLNRQLSFIDSLERAEEDPSTLANLFRLDHLATRMRRNAESLLVLAGIDSGRRLRDAMPLSDVIRTASSEIEQYDRVELDLQVDPHMLGFNALGAAHLLAELLENATIFSEPETPVVVTTGIVGDKVVVRILDHGLGMTDSELEAANIKIASTSASDALGAQRLGLFVVGRIAGRLGAQVQLRKSSQGTGTETFVRFPSTLFSLTEAPQYGTGAPASVQAQALAEAPTAEPVDLAALTAGTTSLGLPRRRGRDDGGPDTEAQAVVPAGNSGLPTRSRKTFDEDNIVLPVAQAPTLSPELSSESASWAPPVAAPLGTGLPSRTRAATTAWQSVDDETPSTPAPASPAARAGLFTGFRRGAELAGDQPSDTQSPDPQQPIGPSFVIPGLAPDDAEESVRPQADPAGAHATPPASFVVPSLEADDDWAPAAPEPEQPAAWGAPVAEQPAAWPAPVVNEQPAAWGAPVADEQPAAWGAPVADEQPAAWGAPVADEQPAAWGAPVADEQPAAWGAPVADEQPAAWAEPVVEEPAAPSFTSYSGYAGWTAPVEQPTPAEPVAQERFEAVAFEPTLDEARAWHTGAIPVVPEPAVEPAAEPSAAAPSWETPTWQAPTWEPPTWQTPTWSTQPEQAAAAPEAAPAPQAYAPEPVVRDAQPFAPQQPAPAPQQAAPAPAPQPYTPEPAAAAAPGWDPQAPIWAPVQGSAAPPAPSWPTLAPDAHPFADTESPTQMFSPVEAHEAVTPDPSRFAAPAPTVASAPAAPAPFAPQTPPAAQQPFAPQAPAPQQPFASQPPAPSSWSQSAPGAHDAEGADGDRPRKLFGLFGRRKSDSTPTPVVATPAVPHPSAPEAAPPRTSAWNNDAPAAAPDAGWARTGGWGAPAAASPQPFTPAPAPAASPFGGWATTERTANPAQAAPQPLPVEPRAVQQPSTAPRIGTLDDEVAAMLALRSDIQEQALSELSQLSAYRPSAMASSERLTRRVPVAVPASTAAVDESKPVQRDAVQLRSRLSSFQSGTSRGRREATPGSDGTDGTVGGPQAPANPNTSSPTW